MKKYSVTALLLIAAVLIGYASTASIHDPLSFLSNGLIETNSLLPGVLVDDEDAKLNVPELIAKYGYPVESHEVTTADGYILTLHRIPYGKNCGPSEEKKRVVFVQHGLLCDSSNWVISGPEKGMAYLLADQCYDVFLGNARGNTYSKRHVSLDPVVDKEAFWSFSWHEMGKYDLPANFDYILNVTGNDGLYYIGHSMGTTMFFAGMSLPENAAYNQKIKLMSALAPVAHTEHMISPLRLIAPYGNEIQWLLKMIGLHEFAPSDDFYELIGSSLCREGSPTQPLCTNVLFLLCGFNPDQIDPTLIAPLLGHLPAGTSVSTIVHYAQGVPSGKFRQFDHGEEKNLEKYGQPEPPEYDLTKITAPIALFWAQNDWLGAPPDTHRIAELLPNLLLKHRVPHNQFNHLDFLIARDIRTLLNDDVIRFMGFIE